MTVRVGVNGFGRIGRNFWRAVDANDHHDIEIVAANDLGDVSTMAHLLKYDSVLGPLQHRVEATDSGIEIDGKELKILAEGDPGALPWGDLGVDVVIESTGFFTKAAEARKHVDPGGSAPGSRSARIFSSLPSISMPLSVASTRCLSGPSTESYLSRWAIVLTSPRSLAATISMS